MAKLLIERLLALAAEAAVELVAAFPADEHQVAPAGRGSFEVCCLAHGRTNERWRRQVAGSGDPLGAETRGMSS